MCYLDRTLHVLPTQSLRIALTDKMRSNIADGEALLCRILGMVDID